MIVRILANGVLPVIAYLVLRAPLRSDLAALAIGTAVPIGWSLTVAAWKRRVDPVAVASLAGLGVALAAALLFGGGTLPILLRHVAVTGTAGLACLISVLVGRPLLGLLRPVLARRLAGTRAGAAVAERAGPVADPRRYFAVLTLVVGAVLLAHAAANVALATTLSTGRYLAVARPVGWAVTAAGALVVIVYMRRARRPR